jgi:hypothetical protein
MIIFTVVKYFYMGRNAQPVRAARDDILEKSSSDGIAECKL